MSLAGFDRADPGPVAAARASRAVPGRARLPGNTCLLDRIGGGGPARFDLDRGRGRHREDIGRSPAPQPRPQFGVDAPGLVADHPVVRNSMMGWASIQMAARYRSVPDAHLLAAGERLGKAVFGGFAAGSATNENDAAGPDSDES